jgi:hypothetical protein
MDFKKGNWLRSIPWPPTCKAGDYETSPLVYSMERIPIEGFPIDDGCIKHSDSSKVEVTQSLLLSEIQNTQTVTVINNSTKS